MHWKAKRNIRRTAAILAFALFVLISRYATAPDSVEVDEVRFMPDAVLAPSMVADISKAESTITGAIYLATTTSRATGPNDLLLKALAAAARRGVSVSMVFDVGDEKDLTTRLNPDAAEILLDAGVSIRYDAPGTLMHAKLLVIDQRVTYIGSHNWTFSGLEKNREASVRINSPEIAMDAARWIDSIGSNGSSRK